MPLNYHLPLIDNRQGVELVVVFIVEPGAFKMVKTKAGQAGKSQGVKRQLFDGLFLFGAGLVIENADLAASHLDKIDVPGDDLPLLKLQRNDGMLPLEVRQVLGGEQHRHFHGHGHRIVDQHELLQRFVAKLILGHCLKDEPGVPDGRVVGLGPDFHLVEIENIFVLGRPGFLFGVSPEEFMRTGFRDLP